jgi:hypothetical protein
MQPPHPPHQPREQITPRLHNNQTFLHTVNLALPKKERVNRTNYIGACNQLLFKQCLADFFCFLLVCGCNKNNDGAGTHLITIKNEGVCQIKNLPYVFDSRRRLRNCHTFAKKEKGGLGSLAYFSSNRIKGKADS